MATRRSFWKWHRWKSIGFCLWPPSTCIWNLKLKFQSKLDLCSGNHVVYRQTDRRTDGRTRWIQYTPPPTSFGGGINIFLYWTGLHYHITLFLHPIWQEPSTSVPLSCKTTNLLHGQGFWITEHIWKVHCKHATNCHNWAKNQTNAGQNQTN